MFVYNTDQDTKGNFYYNAYSNIPIRCVVCLEGKNLVFEGKFKIFKRSGINSQFKDEIGFVFMINKHCNPYPANSKQELIEYYIPFKEGINFLKGSIDHFSKEIGGI